MLMIAGAIAVSAPAFSQEESLAYKNEAPVQAFVNFVKTTTNIGVNHLSTARIASHAATPSLVVLCALALSFAASAGAATIDTMSVDPPAPIQALALYLASAAQGEP